MGLGNLIKDVLTVGGTARRRNKRAKRERRAADALVAQNTELAQQMFDRDRGQSAFTGVTRDPALEAAQQQALGRMQATAAEGYTAVDRQAMDQQMRDVARYEQGQRQALAEDARARGMGGSGFAIQSQLAAQQAGADRATDTAANMAIAGRDRAYQANADAANQAGAMRSQGFGEQAQVAGAQDQYGQWRAGQQSADAGMLMDARLGNAQNLNQRAERRENAFNEGIDQAVQIGGAIANAYTGGAAGAAGGVANSVGGAGGAKSMGAARSQAAAPAATAPQAKSMQPRPAAPAAASSAPTTPANAVNAALGRGAPAGSRVARPTGPAGGAARPAALGGTVATPPAPAARPQTNARRRGSLLLAQPQGGLRGR